jgi:hypothetical protein
VDRSRFSPTTSASCSRSADRRGALLRRHGSLRCVPSLAIEAIDRKPEDAAATLGADRLWVFLTITLPLAMPGVIAGMVLCFAKALGEFGATITFVSNIPGETPDHFAAIYTYPDSRRRRGGEPAGAGGNRDLAGRAHRGRMACAPRRHALPRE